MAITKAYTLAQAQAVPEPSVIVWNLDHFLVYTGDDIPQATTGPTSPSAVTMRQARLALLSAGMLDAVTAAIDALSEPTKTAARITWEYSTEVQRHNGLVSQLAPGLGLSSAQIDALFNAAAAL